ncbi:MAG TPA: site-specific integrase [Abditibacterium sp.]
MENRTSPLAKNAEFGENVGAAHSAEPKAPRLRSPKSGTSPNNTLLGRASRRRGNAPLPVPVGPPAIVSVRKLRSHRDEWLDDNEVGLLSHRTIGGRRDATDRLLTWLREENQSECGTPQLRKFFATQVNLKTGEPLSADTLDTYRRIFIALWNWMKRQRLVSENAMDGIPPVPAGKKKSNQQVQPFNESQWREILSATAKSPFPRRDAALVHLFLDTGIRAGEVCSIQMRHVSMSGRSIRIIGKGDKERTVFYSPLASRFLWAYLRERGIEPDEMPDEWLFVGCSGPNAGGQMTTRGIYGVIQKLCKRCGIRDGKMGPHRLRHTFATEMVKNQAYQDVVQQLLGHSDGKMTQRYVSLAGSDLRAQHARCSPLGKAKPVGKSEKR